MPASSPGWRSITSTSYPFRSTQREYMRNNISAQSWASVPPAPALMETMALFGSSSSLRVTSKDSRLIFFPSKGTWWVTSSMASWSDSSRARSSSRSLSSISVRSALNPSTIWVSAVLSFKIGLVFSGFFQKSSFT